MTPSLDVMNNMSHQHNQHHPMSNNLHNPHMHAPSHDDFGMNAMNGMNGMGIDGLNDMGVGGPPFDDSLLHDDVEDDGAVGDEDDDLDGTEHDAAESGIVGDPSAGISKPGTHDVLLGRGGGTNNHIGNVKFRKLVNEHKMRYLACSKVEKPKVARQVVALWRKLEPPGRFLARADDTKRGPGSVKASDNIWLEVGDKKAREKASQCLRERTPDVMPYIKHLREQQNAITEQGVSMVQRQMQQHESSQQQQQQQQQQQRMMNHAHVNHGRMGVAPGGGQFAPSQQQRMMMQQQQQQQQHFNGFDPSSYGGGNGPNAMIQSPTSGYARHTHGVSPRRSSLPMAPLQSGGGMHPGPNNGHSAMHSYNGLPPSGSRSHGMPPQSQYGTSPRRTSLPMLSSAVTPDAMGLPSVPPTYPSHHGSSFDFESHPMIHNNMSEYEMSEMEYQQQMMMMQQQMMQQQMQMQRMQQSRAAQAAASGRSPPRNVDQQQQQQPPLGAPSNQQVSHMPPPSALKSKRGRGAADDDDHKAAPDRTTSLMSLTPLQDPSNDHELSLEDYRQQLEEYIANSHNQNGNGNGNGAPGHDGGEESDLEDDWEKEREHAVKQAQQLKKDTLERGVNRNASGMSILSKASGGGMSLVSGFSGLSDLLKDDNKDPNASSAHPHKNAPGDREQKMNMARSVSSNLSLMSELTDLSQNIDNLSIYDD